MEDVRKLLNVDIQSPYWQEAYEKALAEPEIPQWLTESYLRKLEDEKHILTEIIDRLIPAAEAVAQVKELVLLAKILANIIAYKDPVTQQYVKRPAKEAFPVFELPKAPAGAESTLAYDAFGFFPIIAHLEGSWEALTQRGVDADVVRRTAGYLSGSVAADTALTMAESTFLEYPHYIYHNWLYIERLRFEIVPENEDSIQVLANKNDELVVLMDDIKLHRCGYLLDAYGFEDEEGAYYAEIVETDQYFEGYAVCQETYLAKNYKERFSKDQWRRVYKKGDAMLIVHIPYGPGFNKESCEHSYTRAREIFKRCYPEYDFKGFTTWTWLLSEGLIPVLKETSNLYHFRKKFAKFPVGCAAAADVFLYVFNMQVKSVADVDLETLSEDNSMRRGVKEQIRQGNYIHEFGGYFLF